MVWTICLLDKWGENVITYRYYSIEAALWVAEQYSATGRGVRIKRERRCYA